MHPAWAGAGGNWPTIDETFDPHIVRQQNQLACGAACAEMLLRGLGIEVTQEAILDQTGVPISPSQLAEAMNSFVPSPLPLWAGGFLQIPGASRAEVFEALNMTGTWGAVLWEVGSKIGHMVVVDGCGAADLVLLRDPWQGTRYKMRKEDFLPYWSDYGVYQRK